VKIYTKTGDKGETGLVDGSRVGKDSVRVQCYGDVDELNACLGLVRSRREDSEVDALLALVQKDLFALGAQLADPQARVARRKPKAAVTPEHVARLEEAIDARQERLPPLRAFILPGGSKTGALLHFCRTVCRRVERRVVSLSQREDVDPLVLVYLNRLSDLLFVLARDVNHRSGETEDTW
jgi:cob(I)alamin adenosyltransferase